VSEERFLTGQRQVAAAKKKKAALLRGLFICSGRDTIALRCCGRIRYFGYFASLSRQREKPPTRM